MGKELKPGKQRGQKRNRRGIEEDAGDELVGKGEADQSIIQGRAPDGDGDEVAIERDQTLFHVHELMQGPVNTILTVSLTD